MRYPKGGIDSWNSIIFIIDIDTMIVKNSIIDGLKYLNLKNHIFLYVIELLWDMVFDKIL